ncbi:helix-turn-helix transcriptional regulator [Thermodesulfobacteriota bacterium]
MARGDQLGRQWKILQLLLSARKGKTALELASALNCHLRTVYRDLDALQVAGFPVYNQRAEGKNLWRLLDAAKQQVPIPFSLTELMALYFSRDMLKVLKNTVFYDSIESLFQKIKTTLPSEYLNYLGQVEQSIQVGQQPYKPYDEFKEILDQVNEAIVHRWHIEIDYFTMSRKKETRRTIAPYKIWFFDGTFYLIGHCNRREAIRIFALDRIKMIRQTKESFELPDDFSVEDFMESSFGIFHGEPVSVRIRFAPSVAGYIGEKIWHDTQKTTPLDDGSLELAVTVAGTDEIKFWIMSWGSKAMVIEPESLHEEIRAEITEMQRNYNSRTKV